MNYKTVNVPADLQEQLLKLKKQGKITAISSFAGSAIAAAIKELKAGSACKSNKVITIKLEVSADE
jgi:hypothetical protein